MTQGSLFQESSLEFIQQTRRAFEDVLATHHLIRSLRFTSSSILLWGSITRFGPGMAIF
jgi:hypothetical protein